MKRIRNLFLGSAIIAAGIAASLFYSKAIAPIVQQMRAIGFRTESTVDWHDKKLNENTTAGKRLEDVRKGIISPNLYLQELLAVSKEAIEARDRGILKGFFFEPSSEELEEFLRNSLSVKIKDKQELEDSIAFHIKNNKFSYGDTASVIIYQPHFGKEIPGYVMFSRNFLRSERDADVLSIIRHELKHLVDYSQGIKLGDIVLNYENAKDINKSLLSDVHECRAYFTELEAAFKELADTGKLSISPDRFYHCASKLHQYRINLASTSFENLRNNLETKEYYTEIINKTDLEKKISHLQLEKTEGIATEGFTPSLERINDSTTMQMGSITFNLFERSERATLKQYFIDVYEK